ncbi:type II toxin-antitoxin system VapC family toxin [Anabaena azotica]|uniref:type II toxin-antitoxin system VapC family toxin n=1 Tax=Anabaena azotica TaxID=197653 RepID=UPI0039A6F3B5
MSPYMKNKIIIDTSPLVALLDKSDSYHQWVTEKVKTLPPPFLTCDAVITESCFLLERAYNGQNILFSLLESGHLQLDFDLKNELSQIKGLMNRYQSVPMSLADACLVRMCELYDSNEIFTLDSDFLIYRKHKNQPISVIIPDSLFS